VPAYITIQWSDLLAAEERNQEQGSIAKRLYGEKIGGAMEPKIDATGADTNIDPSASATIPKGTGTVTVSDSSLNSEDGHWEELDGIPGAGGRWVPNNTHNPETGVEVS
jgi:hypothetical protein